MQVLIAEEICTNFMMLAPIALMLIALVLPITRQHLWKLEGLFNYVARRKRLSILLVGVSTFIGAAIVSYVFYWPNPSIHDEFSYLLAADTFAQGRLANPTHPMWIYFETFHVLQQPTYISKYFPGQGLILAFGQIITGEPIVGVWLSMALACAATCWMLQAWLPPRWALLGSLLMLLKLGLFSYWSQSFWGGGVATIGGALLFGAMRRITKKQTVANTCWLGLGLVILANSRPFEGLVVSSLAIGYLVFWLFSKKTPQLAVIIRQIVVPLAVILTIAGLAMLYYNWRTTGNPWQMAYQIYEKTYGNLPIFIWSKPGKPVSYNHAEMALLYQSWSLNQYKAHLFSLFSFWDVTKLKIRDFWDFFFGWGFIVPLVALPFILKNRWVRLALLICLSLSIALLLEIFNYAHYFAPGVCLLYFLVLQCMRRIYFWRWQNKPTGRLIVWSIPLYYILLIVLTVVLRLSPFFYVTANPWEPTRTLESHWSFKRAELLSKLTATEGQHLVIVNYLPGHSFHEGWVFNRADIDNAKVVWARNISVEKNCDLINYFQGRKVWFLEVGDDFNMSLAAYPINCK